MAKLSIFEQERKLAAALRKSEPFILKIKNVTDDKIYDVNVLENKDERVQVRYGSKSISLKSFKDYIGKNSVIIGMTRVHAFYEFKKFVDKQLMCPINVFENDKLVQKMFPLKDNYQYQVAQVDCNDAFPLQLVKSKVKIIMDYLMPEMEIILYFFPFSKDLLPKDPK